MGACETTPPTAQPRGHPRPPTPRNSSSPPMLPCRSPASSSFALATTRLRALQLDSGPHGSRNHGSYQEEPQSSQPSPATARKPPGQNPTPLDSKGPHGCGFGWVELRGFEPLTPDADSAPSAALAG